MIETYNIDNLKFETSKKFDIIFADYIYENLDLLLFSYLIFVPYVACIYGVNSVAKSKNRDNVAWTIFAAILIHSLIILIIISLLEKIDKPKVK